MLVLIVSRPSLDHTVTIDSEPYIRHVPVSVSHHCNHYVKQYDQVKKYVQEYEVDADSVQIWTIWFIGILEYFKVKGSERSLEEIEE